MSAEKIKLALEKVLYDESIGMSIIEGWAYNSLTMEPVKITSSFPGIINTVNRLDLNRNINIPNNTPYGFFILLPGDYRKYNPIIKFESEPFVKEIKLRKGMRFSLIQKLDNVESYLRNYGLLPNKNKQNNDQESLRKNYAEDELKEWMELVEPEIFNPESKNKYKLTYIVKANSDNIKSTIDSIKETDSNGEILIISEEDINIDEFPVIKPNSELKTLSDLKNKAVEIANGDYITFIDQNDRLASEFYNEVNVAIDKFPNADFIYSDNDLIDKNGRRYEVNFKPDYDQILLSHTNYILNPVIIKKDLLEKIGGFREEFKGLKDYDMILRATKEADNIVHIPYVLYHWMKSTDDFFNLIRKDTPEGIKILNDYLKDSPLKATFSETDFVFDNQLEDEFPGVTIICGVAQGFSDQGSISTLNDILETCTYPNYEILAVNVERFTDNPKIKFISDPKAQNIIELFNNTAKKAKTKYLMFLEPNQKAVVGSWLNEMVDLAEEPKVGLVGPKLFNNHFTYESLGIGIDGNKQYSIGKDTYIQTKGLNNSWLIPKEVFALSHGALLINKELFEKLGGFDLKLFPSDMMLDLSIRARELGFKTVNARNTPILINDLNQYNDLSIEDLLQKFGEEALVDSTENIHVKPSGSAKAYIKEK